MSRDQRPRRTVIIDNGPLDTPARRVDDMGPGSGNADTTSVPLAPASSTLILWAILFLMACAAGAAGVALMLVAR